MDGLLSNKEMFLLFHSACFDPDITSSGDDGIHTKTANASINLSVE
jgi:hypothetical protein